MVCSKCCAAAGNMIAIHNVVAASATVGLLGRGEYIVHNSNTYFILLNFCRLIVFMLFQILDFKDPLQLI